MLRYYLSNVPFVVVIFSWAASPSKHPHACYSKLKEEIKYSFPYTISANLYLNWKLTTLLVDVFHYALCICIMHYYIFCPESRANFPYGNIKSISYLMLKHFFTQTLMWPFLLSFRGGAARRRLHSPAGGNCLPLCPSAAPPALHLHCPLVQTKETSR